jgi:diguanylate cyclase (GGDEF)-like protein
MRNFYLGHIGGIRRPTVAAAVKPKARRNPIHSLILSGVLLITAIVLGTAAMVGTFRERALESSQRELENTVLLLAQHFDQQFQDLQLAQKTLHARIRSTGIQTPEDFTREMSTEKTHLMLRSIVSEDYSGDLTVTNADGKLVNRSLAWPIPDVDLSDRDYFKALKSDPRPDAEYIQPVLSRITGRWKTLFVRKLVGPNGDFLGVVGRGVEPAHFEKFFASVMLGENGAVSMFHTDGTLLARYPHVETSIGKKYTAGPLLQQLAADKGQTTLRVHASPVDGRDRLGAIRKLQNFPIAVIATTTTAAALTDWREQTGFLVGAAGLSALVIAIFLVLIVRQLGQQHRASQQQTELEKIRLDTAVNNMEQGLLLFDSAQRLVVCNRRYIDMYGLSADVVKPGCSFHDILTHRKATGSLIGDVDQYHAGVMSNISKQTIVVVETSDGRFIQIANKAMADGGWLATHEDVTARRQADAKIEHLAHYDALTDLPNRVLFREQIEGKLAALRDDEQFAILYIDIDEFKGINDSLGHHIGDELLKTIADRLRGCVKATDLVARLGGDEFAIVQTNITGQGDVADLVARIYDAIRAPCECLGHQISTDASIGIAMAPTDGADLDQLLKNADLAMYSAKGGGRRTYRFFVPEMDASMRARRALELDMRQTLTDGGFELYYQPLVDLHSNEVTGCEALLRWRHPERGMVSPAEFIPVAEDTGMINELGDWVLRTACAEAASWPDHVSIAVNVSPVQFTSETLALKVAAALAASGLSASRLELEITEAVLIHDDDTALAILHQLRALGVRIALDDFGTGYSSLSYLQRFPFDKIKIDRCFVNDVVEVGGSSSIVQAVVNIAAARNMTTTAEGVETQQQRDLLHTLGCNQMQGFLFSAARPAVDIQKLFYARRARAESAA